MPVQWLQKKPIFKCFVFGFILQIIMAFAIATLLFLVSFTTQMSLQFNSQISWTKILFQKDAKIQDTELEILLKEFDIENPYIVKQKPSLNDGKMFKLLFKNDKFAKMVYNIEEIPVTQNNMLQNNLVIFVTTLMVTQFQITLQLLIQALEGKFMIILMLEKEENFNELYETLEIQINQPVYFYKMPTKELFETYSINNQKIKRKLGFISSKNTNFFWENNISSNFIKRRSNFHGLALKVMVEFSGSSMNVDPTYIEKSPYFSNNETYKGPNYLLL